MRKTFCDRCGEEIKERPAICQYKRPTYDIRRHTGEVEVNVFAHDEVMKAVDLCPHCMEAFEDFMAGMKTVQENRTGGVFDDPEQE